MILYNKILKYNRSNIKIFIKENYVFMFVDCSYLYAIHINKRI